LAFEVFAALVFFEINGHHVLLGALHASFARFPLGGTLVPQPIGPMVDGMTRAHELGVMLASPLAFCLLALTIVLAFAGRIAPQLSIHTVGFTLQSVVSLVGFAFLLPDVFRLLASFTARGGETVSRFMG
jgi:flagellar biosynthesis protein FliR